MARPTEYKEKEILKASREYLDSCYEMRQVYEVLGDEVKIRGKKKVKVKRVSSMEKMIVRVPTIEGLALRLQISRDTLYAWKKKHKEFSYIIEELQHKQAEALINNGLTGDYNSTIAKVLLTKHGYREGVEHTGDEGGPIAVSDERKKQVGKAIDDVLPN